jgi:hypothetical protein
MNVDTSDDAFERLEARSPTLARPVKRYAWWGRRVVLLVALPTVVAALAAGAFYVLRYQPLEPRGWSSATGSSLKTTDDGIRSTGFLMDATPGNSARLTLDVKNTGRFPVTITRLDPGHELDRLGFSGQWVAPDEQNHSDVLLSSELRNFPVTVRAGAEVTLSLAFTRRSSCVSGETSAFQTIGVASRALEVAHRLTLDLPLPIYLCWRPGAHVGGASTESIG